MSINALMDALVAELVAGEVPAPLHQKITVAALWCDLARLAGEDAPPDVAALADEPCAPLAPLLPFPSPLRLVK